ncbi:hypothetical protein LDL48_39960 [Wangella sp. NEAU-J3]|nr:hypothetical protein [Jidongwangia harbinensis]
MCGDWPCRAATSGSPGTRTGASSRCSARPCSAYPPRTSGIFAASPFETIDTDGVGELVRIAVERGRATRPDLTVGVCGEHGGDPASVRFFHHAGLDYVSCSPFRVPVARLEAGRAACPAASSDSR